MAATKLKVEETWTEEKVMALTKDEVLELWGNCPAVEMAELCGEYTGLIPNAGNEQAQKATAEVMYNENSRTGYYTVPFEQELCPGGVAFGVGSGSVHEGCRQ